MRAPGSIPGGTATHSLQGKLGSMDYFLYKNHIAHCEDVSLQKIAEAVGTPAYVYSSATIERHCAQLKNAFQNKPAVLCYAVKANSNLGILQKIFQAGFGADVVSLGELERALLAGAKTQNIVFSGVGKSEAEIERALDVGILSFNVEAFFELENICRIAARKKKQAALSLRVNPDIDAKTHPKIATGLHSTKFGIAIDQLDAFLNFIRQHPKELKLIGLACHIGSQLTDLQPIQDAAKKMVALTHKIRAQGFTLTHLNLGGGLGIRYTDENPPGLQEYAEALEAATKDSGCQLILEPGRVIVGNAGVLLTRVLGIKNTAQKKFAIVDAAMNDLIRPSLYGSHHEIHAAHQKPELAKEVYDIVGPICETGDFLSKDEELQQISAHELLYIRSCGAYGATMASNYNSRPHAAEVMVYGAEFTIIKPRQLLSDLWRDELRN